MIEREEAMKIGKVVRVLHRSNRCSNVTLTFNPKRSDRTWTVRKYGDKERRFLEKIEKATEQRPV